LKLRTKLLSLLLAVLLLAALALPAAAAHVSGKEAIDTLSTLGLFRGDGEDFAPERRATRAEALVILLRLLGREEAALREQSENPFLDRCWADAYIGYAEKNGLVCGVDAEHFGADRFVDARDFATFALRALGYRDSEGAFTWADSLRFSDGLGLTSGEYRGGELLLREDLALIAYTALTLPLADGSMTLIERLYLDGVVSAEALKQTRLADAVYAGRPRYTTAELYERCASAVFLVKSYDSADDYVDYTAFGRASGFFIRGDGLALMSWHQLDNASYADAVMMDGRTFPILEVLFFDPMQDIALVRVSRADREGNEVRFFPWIPLGDSDAVCVGEEIITVSNPKGNRGVVSDGVLSSKNQLVDDPDCLKLMNTAAV